MDDRLKTKERNELVPSSSKHKEFLRKVDEFQRQTVIQYNPKSTIASKLIIPPVSVRDEVRIDGFGMVIIELLCLTGILIEVKKRSCILGSLQ